MTFSIRVSKSSVEFVRRDGAGDERADGRPLQGLAGALPRVRIYANIWSFYICRQVCFDSIDRNGDLPNPK
jgi:hypothetical protein